MTDRSVPSRPLLALAVVAAIEGLSFLAYSAYYLVQEFRLGPTGPADVSSNTTIVLQIIIFALFGAGLMAVAYGWWHAKRWSRGPFLLAQILVLVVSIPLAGSAGLVEKSIGILFTALAIVGGVVSMTPTITRAIVDNE